MKKIETKWMHPAEQLALIIGKIYNKSMTTTSGGNLSIMDENGDMWITPSSVDKGSLTSKDIMCVKADGRIIGAHKPSSEYPFHKAIYKMRPEMRAVIHAHPSALVAFSIVHRTPDTTILPQVHELCGKIGFAAYAVPGSEELGVKIAEEFREHPEYTAVTMENHGIVLCGGDLLEAYSRFETLELSARIQLNASILGQPISLTGDQLCEYRRLSGAITPAMQECRHTPEEIALRTEICDLAHRACNQGLMSSLLGSVSKRYCGNSFVITPAAAPLWQITSADLVQINELGEGEPEKRPNATYRLHQAIYAQCPKVNSVITAQPTALMGFAVSHVPFDVRTIPESWIFLQDVYQLPFGTGYNHPEEVTKILQSRPCVMINNEMIVTACDRLIDTFDRLEVAEFSAQSLINTAPIGKLSPMSDKDIEDLRIAFNV